MLTDIEIAKSVKLRPINEVAAELGIHEDQVENYGRYIAKITTARIDRNKFKNHHLILVTAISPTKAGNGKTTVSVGLALGMQKIGKKAVVALREPSLGPCFGMKGGAAGGDEVWIGEKFQSNPEIAGSPRNSFRASLDRVLRR